MHFEFNTFIMFICTIFFANCLINSSYCPCPTVATNKERRKLKFIDSIFIPPLMPPMLTAATGSTQFLPPTFRAVTSRTNCRKNNINFREVIHRSHQKTSEKVFNPSLSFPLPSPNPMRHVAQQPPCDGRESNQKVMKIHEN